MIGSCSCQVLRRTRAALVRLRAAGGARVSLALGWALRSGSCRLGCALVGAAFFISCCRIGYIASPELASASYTNGLGMALLSPSMCHSSRECRGRCLMGMDRYAILLLYFIKLPSPTSPLTMLACARTRYCMVACLGIQHK